ncbi:MAG: hypothetical protein SPI77_04155 [Corynebacterium sp.]|nr:hypothetical protein [Corynebacterium sp.]
MDTVRPPDRGVEHFTVVQEVFGKLLHNEVFVGEHEKPGTGGVEFAIGSAPGCTDAFQIGGVVEFLPRVGPTVGHVAVAVAVDGLLIESVESEDLDDFHVGGVFGLIAYHGQDFGA